MDISDVLRSRRAALGLSQAELAKAAGVSLRQLARYEAGDQQPVLSAAVALADALGISMDQLAGKVNYDLDLSGDWWCAWQTWKDGAPRIDTHPLEVHQRGEVLQLNAERAVPVAEGSYRWRGELRMWDTKPSSAGTGQPTPPCDPRAPCTSPSTSMAPMPGAAGSA
jgi:transcriptional regulator with XRE-family HTH domain